MSNMLRFPLFRPSLHKLDSSSLSEAEIRQMPDRLRAQNQNSFKLDIVKKNVST